MPRRRLSRPAASVLLAAALALPVSRAAAQGAGRSATASGAAAAPVEASYVVAHGDRRIGQEQVTLQTAGGTTLVVRAHYPTLAEPVELETTVERDAAGALGTFLLDGRIGSRPVRAAAARSGARTVVRTLVDGAETGRELPGGPILILDDAVPGLLAQAVALATGPGARLLAVFPRTGRVAPVTARRSGDRVVLAGAVSATIIVAADGLPERIELPEAGLTVSRGSR